MDEKPEEVERIARFVGLDLLQFHGTESQQYCSYFKGLPWGLIKAWRMEEDNFDGVAAYKGLVSALLFGQQRRQRQGFPLAEGEGTLGRKADIWQAVWTGKCGPGNCRVAPWGVDASSRWSPAHGCKDQTK